MLVKDVEDAAGWPTTHGSLVFKDNIAEQDSTHVARLRDKARAAGMDYYLLETTRPLDEALREYLSVRQGRL